MAGAFVIVTLMDWIFRLFVMAVKVTFFMVRLGATLFVFLFDRFFPFLWRVLDQRLEHFKRRKEIKEKLMRQGLYPNFWMRSKYRFMRTLHHFLDTDRLRVYSQKIDRHY
ncbi:hypothetical protein VNN41_10075 [Lactococcus garvieae]|uniref:hypothetical protein n=1 Tax=Lactococcus garvieae TaxID=1363 RepID=UPI003255B956